MTIEPDINDFREYWFGYDTGWNVKLELTADDRHMEMLKDKKGEAMIEEIEMKIDEILAFSWAQYNDPTDFERYPYGFSVDFTAPEPGGGGDG